MSLGALAPSVNRWSTAGSIPPPVWSSEPSEPPLESTRPSLVRLLGFPLPRVLGWAAVAGALALAVWSSPVSPAALSWADTSLGAYEPALAASRYDQVASLHPIPWVRQEAQYRSALILGTELRATEDAAERLRAVISAAPEGHRAADAWELLGHLLRRNNAADAEAGNAFQLAFNADRSGERAEARLLLAARAFSEAGSPEQATAAWRRVEKAFPQHKARSRIALAQLALASGDAQRALALYEEAIPHANDADVRQVAALGASTCLERLGNLDSALAELDGADLPDAVRNARREGMASRRSVRGE